MKRRVKALAATVSGLVFIGLGALWMMPPDLLRVGTGYAAKIVCSNVFVAGRDADDVLRVDVQAPGHPLLGYVSVDVDIEQGLVTASMPLGWARSVAVHREGLGCANVPDGALAAAKAYSAPVAGVPAADPTLPWPDGERVNTTDLRVADVLSDETLLGPGYRAVIVIKDGRIIGEAYGAGFNAETPLLGWSMTKTVNAALVGILQGQGRLDLSSRNLFASWTDEVRARITLTDLLAMESGLDFNEEYGDLTDVTRMLYLEPDMAAYVEGLPSRAEPGSRFNYSSGESVLITRYWMSRFETPQAALDFPRQALFNPLGMTSAVLEADAAGTFVGSSYLYATARDWARFGLLIAQRGVWKGVQLLPASYVDGMYTASGASDGAYSRVQTWRQGAGDLGNEQAGLDPATVWMRGHDGQSIAVIASQGLVVVRLGLTPSALGYQPQPLAKALSAALQ
ncbi:serine hydrolase [Rhizobium sp. AAP43]|uniref:serine hydrolase domain-containing protein n=1 Tax=Rhizobium sp. AAP43 TaxID=1523420 RepID=UPI0006B8825E|nr:serine hydrolase [Rhizobium sp. AAP43]KPF42438.1 6-aminohexanoate hydrolase [Rhizobium sp. AAP43]